MGDKRERGEGALGLRTATAAMVWDDRGLIWAERRRMSDWCIMARGAQLFCDSLMLPGAACTWLCICASVPLCRWTSGPRQASLPFSASAECPSMH
jgi:hypothetical protein